MMQQKRVWDEKKHFGKGGGPIITSGLWSSWVILPLGPWSLPRGRGGPAGNWSRPALKARWRISQLQHVLSHSFHISFFIRCPQIFNVLWGSVWHYVS